MDDDQKAMLDELAAQMEEHTAVEFILDKHGDGQDYRQVFITDIKFEDGVVKVELAE